jgi:predicted GIY-YIG superfamily endonuclease
MSFYVYLLVCSDSSTYIGATTDLNNRLRKHNKEIKGGAVATGKKVSQGHIWERACHVSGFPDWTSALQFEWRWKQISRKLSPKLFPLNRRLLALERLLLLDRPTTKALLYTEWENLPIVILEMDIAKKIIEQLNIQINMQSIII